MFVPLVIQHACALLSSVASPAVPYFSTLSHKQHDFRGKKSYWTQNACFDFLYNFWLKHHSKKYRTRCDQKCILVFIYNTPYPCPILKKLAFSRHIFEKILKYEIFMEIRRVGAEFFHADKQTDEQNEMWLKMCIGLHVQYPLSLSSFKETCIFSTYFRKKNLKYEIFMKICREN